MMAAVPHSEFLFFFVNTHCFTAFCHKSSSQSPPSASVCLLSVSVWILFERLLPFHDLCPKVSLSSKLSSKCIHAHIPKTLADASS